MLSRARGQVPGWLKELRGKVAVARPATFAYINIKKLVELASQQSPDAKRIISILGLDQLQSVASTTGLTATDYVNRILLTVDGPPRGLLSGLNVKPLTAADLQSIPRGAPLAISFQLDPAQAVDLWLNLAGQIAPAEAQKMTQGLAAAEQQIGINLREEVLGTLGPTWRIFGQPGPSGMITGLTISVQVRDRDRLARAHDRLMALANNALARNAGGPTIRSKEENDRTIYSLSLPQPMPISPSWCLTKRELIFAITPQALNVALKPNRASIATQPALKPLLSENSNSLALVYLDTRTVFETLLPMVQMGLQMAQSQAQVPPGLLDTSKLPPAEVISRHLQPTIAVVRRRAGGVEFASRQTLPGGNMAAVAPVAVALLLPAVQAARESARRSQSVSNLRQIVGGMHNYHNENPGFPARYTADENGKPLLSWRVQLLPHVGEKQLYEMFQLDEPWDSPHNRQLIAQIPDVYRAPGSSVEPGKTNYLGNAGPDGVFVAPQPPNGQGTTMSDIKDETSNTIAVVEASDDAAVIWTKPGDFTPDEADPLKGLVGLRNGVFLVGLADGSIKILPATLDANQAKAGFTKAGGELVQGL